MILERSWLVGVVMFRCEPQIECILKHQDERILPLKDQFGADNIPSCKREVGTRVYGFRQVYIVGWPSFGISLMGTEGTMLECDWPKNCGGVHVKMKRLRDRDAGSKLLVFSRQAYQWSRP